MSVKPFSVIASRADHVGLYVVDTVYLETVVKRNFNVRYKTVENGKEIIRRKNIEREFVKPGLRNYVDSFFRRVIAEGQWDVGFKAEALFREKWLRKEKRYVRVIDVVLLHIAYRWHGRRPQGVIKRARDLDLSLRKYLEGFRYQFKRDRWDTELCWYVRRGRGERGFYKALKRQCLRLQKRDVPEFKRRGILYCEVGMPIITETKTAEEERFQRARIKMGIRATEHRLRKKEGGD